ncbi:MAG: hypothetical protein EOM50_14965 [Erysipelotrichia bacterium]|nr:hypothetical protein [Erysipelotrichia bacterium]
MSSVAAIVAELKKNEQDFEFYPTTNEILEAMFWDIKSHKRNFWFKDENSIQNKGYDAEYEFQSVSILDIGAGNCKLLDKFYEISEAQRLKDKYGNSVCDNMLGINKYMAIEKSQILISKMPKEAIVVGTDFNENTIIDKQADIVFCNPPYREYEAGLIKGRTYHIDYGGGSCREIPKVIYDALNLLDTTKHEKLNEE